MAERRESHTLRGVLVGGAIEVVTLVATEVVAASESVASSRRIAASTNPSEGSATGAFLVLAGGTTAAIWAGIHTGKSTPAEGHARTKVAGRTASRAARRAGAR